MENNSPKRYIRIDDNTHSDINDSGYFLEDKEKFDEFGPISNLNIFVGANSSGKSRFLRGILKTPNNLSLFQGSINNWIQTIKSSIEACRDKAYTPNGTTLSFEYNFNHNLNYTHPNESLQYLVNRRQNTNYLNISYNLNRDYFENTQAQISNFARTNLNELSQIIAIHIHVLTLGLNILRGEIKTDNNRHTGLFVTMDYFGESHVNEFTKKMEELLEVLKSLSISYEVFTPAEKIYIPILRTANSIYSPEVLGKIPSKTYEHSVLVNYKIEHNSPKLRIFTGLDLFQQIRATRNSKKLQRKNFEDFEDFLQENFFPGRVIDIIAHDTDELHEAHIMIHFSDEPEKDRDIHDLGDGIQAIILLMYPIFTAPENSWIFIEEPEINLHPGLQRIFIEQILQNKVIKKKIKRKI